MKWGPLKLILLLISVFGVVYFDCCIIKKMSCLK